MAKHIESIGIEMFRGIKNLQIDNIGDINILVGSNNSGKTSVLEAIKLLQYPDDIGSICRVALSRGPKLTKSIIIEYFASMFVKNSVDSFNDTLQDKNSKNDYMINLSSKIKDKKVKVEIVGEIIKKLKLSLDGEEELIVDDDISTTKKFAGTIKLNTDSEKTQYVQFEIDENFDNEVEQTNKMFNCIYVPSTISIYNSCVRYLSKAIIDDKKEELLSLLKIFDKKISDISSIDSNIWVHKKNKGSMPLFSYGTGMQKALLLAGVLVQTKGGVMLVDEVDNAIHVSALSEVFSWLIKACKNMNVQLFVTTHSLEALDTILEISSDIQTSENVRVITLKKQDEKTLSRVLTGDKALQSRDDFNLELRL